MTRLPFQLARTRSDMKVYVAPDLCGELILGSDWLRQHKAQIHFDPATVTLDGEVIPLEEDNCERLPVVAHADIRLPPRTTITGEGEIMVEGAPNDGLYQITPTDEYDNKEGEVIVCSSLVKGSGTIPLLLTNSANKTIRIKRKEELAQAYPVREVDQVRIRNEDRFRNRTEVNELRDENITVPDRYRRRLKGLLRSNREVIAITDEELGQTKTVEMRIDTGEHPPIKLRPYMTPIQKRKLVEEAVNEVMDSGMIERSKSPSCPIVIVEKMGGGHSFCVDFRQLNAITKPLAVPLPLIDDILALQGKSKCFSTLELRSGYWQVVLNKEDREKTAFTCHMGLFNFRVMPFGLANV